MLKKFSKKIGNFDCRQQVKMIDLRRRKYLICVLKQAVKMRRNEVDPTSLLPQFIDRDLLV